jgi:hypothetical protein
MLACGDGGGGGPADRGPQGGKDTGTAGQDAGQTEDAGQADTGGDAGVAAAIQSAECHEQSTPKVNVLRYPCTVTTNQPAEVHIEYQEEAGGPVLTTKTSAAGTDHEFTLVNLKAETKYNWTAKTTGSTSSGTFTTNALPAELSNIVVDVVTPCNGCGTEHALMSYGCASGTSSADIMIIIDTAGHVVWYEDLKDVLGRIPQSIEVISYTEDSTFLAVVERQWVIEIDVAGTTLLALHKGVTPGFDCFVSHEVQKKDGRIWALSTRDGGDYLYDGVCVFNESGGLEWTWDLQGHYTPTTKGTDYWSKPPYKLNGIDWAHSNAISVNSDGSFLFSMTMTSGILNVLADGSVDWELKGDGTGAFKISGSPKPNFWNQHDVYRRSDGHIILDDTRNNDCKDSCEPARILDLELGGDTAYIRSVWNIDEVCPTQGSGTAVGDDHMLTSCSSLSTLKEVGHDGTGFWEAKIGCKAGTAHNNPIYRVTPFSF